MYLIRILISLILLACTGYSAPVSNFKFLGISKDGKYTGYINPDTKKPVFIDVKNNKLLPSKTTMPPAVSDEGRLLFFHSDGDEYTNTHKVKFLPSNQWLQGIPIYELNLEEKKFGHCVGFRLTLTETGIKKDPRTWVLQDDQKVPKSRNSEIYETCPNRYAIESAYAGTNSNALAVVIRQYRCSEHCTPAHDIGHLVVTHTFAYPVVSEKK